MNGMFGFLFKERQPLVALAVASLVAQILLIASGAVTPVSARILDASGQIVICSVHGFDIIDGGELRRRTLPDGTIVTEDHPYTPSEPVKSLAAQDDNQPVVLGSRAKALHHRWGLHETHASGPPSEAPPPARGPPSFA